ncbi:MAG: MBL fold metallo-hydrolase [Desulfovibrio sp.]|nr:MBL fold metallo-hydrolase [Desulfovibrio sp.]
MKIQFLGAAKTVTGSCFLLKSDTRTLLVDCGLHQGNKAIEQRNREEGILSPSALDGIFITHAHIDHSGLLPKLVASGYEKPIFCTAATKELLEIMLIDSAHIQEMEAKNASKKYARRGWGLPPKPLYTQEDAEKTCSLLTPVAYQEPFEPFAGIRAIYTNAGHILGSGSLHLCIQEGKQSTSLLFSGDVGRPNSLIVQDPDTPETADYIFLESTYGDRDHKNEERSVHELKEAIDYSYRQGEKVLIPAFAVERTQEILCCLHMLAKANALPKDMPIFVDSPLAIRASAVFSRHRDLFDAQTRALLGNGEDIFALPNLFYTERTEESQAINERKGPAIVIAASGMCTAGRIKHHLRHQLWRTGASIVFVGYQAQGTIGRKLIDGAQVITLFGEDIQVAAKIFTINGFSGHAGQSQLLAWLAPLLRPTTQVVLVHGEAKAQRILSQKIFDQFGLSCAVPDYLEEMDLCGQTIAETVMHADAAYPTIAWDALANDVERQWAIFRERLRDIEHKPWVDQKELEDRLATIQYHLNRLITRV